MIRVIKSVFAVAVIAVVGIAPSSCQTGGIGDPCTPEDEFDPAFAGFQVGQENIESRSYQCESRICLVNHFQGRVSCPLGQPSRVTCAGPDDSSCTGAGEKCTEAGTDAPDCEEDKDCGIDSAGNAIRTCNSKGKFCECDDDTDCAADAGFKCDLNSKTCKQYVCHNPDNCQDPNRPAAENEGKVCCVPGTQRPVASAVCGQCEDQGGRNAARSVYCSCRCGVAEGQPEDENFNFCDCPDGFVCAEVRPDVGLGDPQLAGKYCVKQEDPILKGEKVDVAQAALKCGGVVGYLDQNCEGTFSSGP